MTLKKTTRKPLTYSTMRCVYTLAMPEIPLADIEEISMQGDLSKYLSIILSVSPSPSLQAVFNVTKRYPLTEEDYHTLAGIQAATYTAEHAHVGTDPAALQPLMHKFYPSHLSDTFSGRKSIGKLFRQKSVEQTLAEDGFRKSFDSVRAKSTSPHNLKILYLQYCWSKPFYG